MRPLRLGAPLGLLKVYTPLVPASVFRQREEIGEQSLGNAWSIGTPQFPDVDEHCNLVRERSFSPVMHQPMQVAPAPLRVQVRCIGKVIANEERHPNIGLGLPNVWPLWRRANA